MTEMTDYAVRFTISTDTFEHAQQVMGERLNHDEDLGFDYTISGGQLSTLLPPEPPTPELVQTISEHPGWVYESPEGYPRAQCVGCGETEPVELTRKQLGRNGDDWYAQHLAGVLTRAGYVEALEPEYALFRDGAEDVEFNEVTDKPWTNREEFLAATAGEPENVLRLERRVGEWNEIKGTGE